MNDKQIRNEVVKCAMLIDEVVTKNYNGKIESKILAQALSILLCKCVIECNLNLEDFLECASKDYLIAKNVLKNEVK